MPDYVQEVSICSDNHSFFYTLDIQKFAKFFALQAGGWILLLFLFELALIYVFRQPYCLIDAITGAFTWHVFAWFVYKTIRSYLRDARLDM